MFHRLAEAKARRSDAKGIQMRSLPRRIVVGVVVTAFVFVAGGATTAAAVKAKSTQTEATWVSFDAEKKTVKVKVKKPGKGAKPPKHLKLKKGKEAEFNVIPTGSILKRTSVAINGKKGDLTDIPAGKTVNIYWVPDPNDEKARFARKIDLFKTAEEQGVDAD